jgi:hypothetical protein
VPAWSRSGGTWYDDLPVRRLTARPSTHGEHVERYDLPSELARVRLANQQISVHPHRLPEDVVRSFGAMQGQDYRNGLWAIGLRSPETSEAAVEEARAGAAIVRTWAMRGTLHFVAAADVRWIVALLAPRVIAGSAYRRRQLEIDATTLTRSRAALGTALSGGKSLSRREALAVLDAEGIQTVGQRGIHILRHLSLEGLLCQATARAGQSTFALLDEWVPGGRTMDRDAALAELAHRYFTSHGPATFPDFVWWSGLTVADARVALGLTEDALQSETVGDVTYWMPPEMPLPRPVAPIVSLLPAFDEYILGYTDRRLAMDSDTFQRIVPGGNGVFRPVVLVDGRVVGTWRLGNSARPSAVVELFSTLTPVAARGVTAALRLCDAFVGASLAPG